MKMLNWILIFILAIPLAFIQPSLVRADAIPSVVHGTVDVWALPGESVYLVDSINVAKDGVLRIHAGVTVIFSPGSELVVEGSLFVDGSSISPVVLRAHETSVSWSGIRSICGDGSVILHNIVVSQIADGIHICAEKVNITWLTICDSKDETLEIGKAGFVYSDDVALEHIDFNADSWGSATSAMGVHLKGEFQNISLLLHFPRVGMIAEPLESRLVTIDGSRNVIYATATSGSGCSLEIGGTLTHLYFSDSHSCPVQVIPTVFVPGYGTSINLFSLSQSSPAPTGSDDWHFINVLTPQYADLLQWFIASNVPYKVAYYDWRLPVETIVERYLKPVIEQVKQQYHTDKVNIVTHSFGGIVARYYVQSEQYSGDVNSMVQIAPPNAGSAKVYSVWEGGVLPSDWQVLDNLVRVYQYQHRIESLSQTQVIRKYFPSVRDLMPTYQALFHNELPENISNSDTVNTVLVQMNKDRQVLERRTRVITIASSDERTIQEISVGNPNVLASEWEDGSPLSDQIPSLRIGDGVVLQSSAESVGTQHIVGNGDHMSVVSWAAPHVISLLYPEKSLTQPSFGAARNTTNMLWFTFDCSVSVKIKSPDGNIYDSSSRGTDEVVEQSGGVLWMMVPRVEGMYSVEVTSQTDGPVRWWVNQGDIHLFDMKSGEVRREVYQVPPENTNTSPVVTSDELGTEDASTGDVELVNIPTLLSLSWSVLNPINTNYQNLVLIPNKSKLKNIVQQGVRVEPTNSTLKIGGIVSILFLLLPP